MDGFVNKDDSELPTAQMQVLSLIFHAYLREKDIASVFPYAFLWSSVKANELAAFQKLTVTKVHYIRRVRLLVIRNYRKGMLAPQGKG